MPSARNLTWQPVEIVGDGLTAGTALQTRDAGPAQTVTRTYTTSSDATGTIAISPAASAGMRLVATDIIISVDTAMAITIQEETSGTVFAKVYLPQNGTCLLQPRGYLKTAIPTKKFYLDASASGNVSVTCITFEEA